MASRLRTLEVKVRIDMELLLFVASGEQQAVAPQSSAISDIPAVGPEDVVFPQMDPIVSQFGQLFPPAPAGTESSSNGATQPTTLPKEPPREEQFASINGDQHGFAGFPEASTGALVETPLVDVSASASGSKLLPAASGMQESLQWLEQLSSDTSNSQPPLLSSPPEPRLPEPEPEPQPTVVNGAPDAAAVCDATSDNHEDLVSMERLRSMKMAELAQMLVGQPASTASSAGLEEVAVLRGAARVSSALAF